MAREQASAPRGQPISSVAVYTFTTVQPITDADAVRVHLSRGSEIV